MNKDKFLLNITILSATKVSTNDSAVFGSVEKYIIKLKTNKKIIIYVETEDKFQDQCPVSVSLENPDIDTRTRIRAYSHNVWTTYKDAIETIDNLIRLNP